MDEVDLVLVGLDSSGWLVSVSCLPPQLERSESASSHIGRASPLVFAVLALLVVDVGSLSRLLVAER